LSQSLNAFALNFILFRRSAGRPSIVWQERCDRLWHPGWNPGRRSASPPENRCADNRFFRTP